ncbi:MAG: NAD(P)(+) transhydrogenase (Re/Si-specific) subunit beta [Deltaproteobacteria bacterium]|nr:NAD(P)(+) transhydrogenase (Re/Si-specific) subunit beta [Deltaproteobacteria bacterium]
MRGLLIDLSYLVASALFILGLRGLAHPRTAVRGNLLGALGMLLAALATLFDRRILGFEMIGAGLIVGSVIGAALALTIRMTAMPQMVALLNGFGGAASVLVAGAVLIEAEAAGAMPSPQLTIATVASGLIGAVTFWGSLVAGAKLQELFLDRPVRFPGQQAINGLLALVACGLGVWVVADPFLQAVYWSLLGVASVLGVLLVIPIGGADMPVVIALLNSYSGLAAAATGFALANNILIIAGSLVGASGLILTRIMCQAMNRSLIHVVFGSLPPDAEHGGMAEKKYAGRVKSVSPEEVALLFETARRVVIVPGYGMAVSQAQHSVAGLAELLEGRGIRVDFAIHPVAGRMPGQMNVLLAEANVPYEKLRDMDEINPEFPLTDVVLVIGANDIVNPSARTDSASPIAGMPILDVDKARTVVVVKRSLSPGFAGVPNPLFGAPNALMLFGDANKMVLELVRELKEA